MSALTSPGADIRNVFRRFVATEIGELLIVYYARVPFEEATHAIDARVYFGTAVLCRSSLETAFFVFLFGRWESGRFFIDYPRTKTGKKRRVSFEELRKEIMKAINFPQSALDAIRRIQEHGNLSAHFGALRIEGTQGWEQEVLRENARLLQNNPTPEKWRQLNERLQRDAKIWVTPTQALADLRETAGILSILFRESVRRQATSMILLS